jgi:predicted transcriptional regulator
MDIKKALERVLSWPADRQEDAVRILKTMEASDRRRFALDDEQLAGIDAALAAADRGEFATQDEVDSFWRKWGA